MDRATAEQLIAGRGFTPVAQHIPRQRFHLHAKDSKTNVSTMSIFSWETTPDITTMAIAALLEPKQKDAYIALTPQDRDHFFADLNDATRYIAANTDVKFDVETGTETVAGVGSVPERIIIYVDLPDSIFSPDTFTSSGTAIMHAPGEVFRRIERHLKDRNKPTQPRSGVEDEGDIFMLIPEYSLDWHKVETLFRQLGFETGLHIEPGPDAHWEIFLRHRNEPEVVMGAQCTKGNQESAVRVIGRLEAHPQLVEAYSRISEGGRDAFHRDIELTAKRNGVAFVPNKHAESGIVVRYSLVDEVYESQINELLLGLCQRVRNAMGEMLQVYRAHLEPEAMKAAAKMSSSRKQ